jgi:hypothetical protein
MKNLLAIVLLCLGGLCRGEVFRVSELADAPGDGIATAIHEQGN